MGGGYGLCGEGEHGRVVRIFLYRNVYMVAVSAECVLGGDATRRASGG